VDVLGVAIKKACIGFRLFQQRREGFRYCLSILSRQDIRAYQSVRVRDARANISRKESTVKPKRVVELAEGFVGFPSEASAPRFLLSAIS
jgi:hypothetical protein